MLIITDSHHLAEGWWEEGAYCPENLQPLRLNTQRFPLSPSNMLFHLPPPQPVNFFPLPFLLFFDGSRFSPWKGRPVSVCSVMTRQPRESTHVWATGWALIAGDWPSAEIWTAFIRDAIWTTQDPRREQEKRHQPPSPL